MKRIASCLVSDGSALMQLDQGEGITPPSRRLFAWASRPRNENHPDAEEIAGWKHGPSGPC